MTVTLTIPGKPFGKQRPRFSRKNGVAFTPKETVSFEQTVRTIAAQHFPEPIDGPVKITVLASFECAKSWSKKKTAQLIHRPHTQRPDLDNIAKAITDGLNRVAYADDSQIAEMLCRKVWGRVSQTVVFVEAM